ncbi:hypothetical protein [Mycobacterium servetii]|uniref:Uncharacterized protein n=1 Tax=Mycobacterium servetii TaxID=3237418 RepID=A0ABV4BZM7_9MYCO
MSELSMLLFAAMEGAEDVDRNRLLLAASAFLDATTPLAASEGAELARTMAFRAMDWAVFDTAETYHALFRAVSRFAHTCRVC